MPWGGGDSGNYANNKRHEKHILFAFKVMYGIMPHGFPFIVSRLSYMT